MLHLNLWRLIGNKDANDREIKEGYAFLSVYLLVVLILGFIIKNEKAQNTMGVCKQLRITNQQTNEVIEIYGTQVKQIKDQTFTYIDKNGIERFLILSNQDPVLLDIQVVDERFCDSAK